MNFQTLIRQRKFILFAAIAGLVAMFLPWTTLSAGGIFEGSGGDSMTQNGMHGPGIAVFLSFICARAFAFLGDQTRALEKTNWLIALVAGAAALLFGVILLAGAPTEPTGFVKSTVGYGAWIGLVAAAGVLASAWMFKNPGETIRDSFEKLKNDLSFPAGPPPANRGPVNGADSNAGDHSRNDADGGGAPHVKAGIQGPDLTERFFDLYHLSGK